MTKVTKTENFIECDMCHTYLKMGDDKRQVIIRDNLIEHICDLCLSCYPEFLSAMKFLASVDIEVDYRMRGKND